MKLFKSIVGAAALVCLASAAQAQNFYVGAYGGGNYTHDGNANGNDKMVYDLGYGIGAFGGYALPSGLRFEGEIAYRSNSIDTIDGVSVGGDLNSWAVMGNLLYEIQTEGKIKPHIGGGVGFARASIESGSAKFSDTVLAAQFIVGIDYELAPDLGLVADYRQFRTKNLSLGAGSGLGNVEYANSTVSIGIRKKF